MRLTNEIRSNIIDKVIDEIISPEVIKIKDKVTKIAQHTADHRYSKNIQAWVDSAPKGGLDKQYKVELIISEDDKGRKSLFSHKLFGENKWGNASSSIALKTPIPVLQVDHYRNGLTPSKKHINDLKSISDKADELLVRKSKIKETLTSAL